jgi:hypothetical protein
LAILIIGGVLLGAILGRFFKVLVLAPAFAFSLAIVVASSANFGHSLPRALLEFVVLITGLQIGYASGLLFPSVSERPGTTAHASTALTFPPLMIRLRQSRRLGNGRHDDRRRAQGVQIRIESCARPAIARHPATDAS